jgi:pullulanase
MPHLLAARAHWIAAPTLLWPAALDPDHRYELHSALGGGLRIRAGKLAGGEALALQPAPRDPRSASRFPHLAGYSALALDEADLPRARELVRGQLAVAELDTDGRVLDATGVQLPGVLDDLFRYDGPLGVTYHRGVPTVRVWAPTARNVRLLLFDNARETTRPRPAPISRDDATGVWHATGTPDWTGRYYLFEIEVFAPSVGRVVHNRVTDPYSVSLSANGRRSQIVDLDDPALKPDGWDALVKPPLAAPVDATIYELHVRDFSIHDASVSPAHRGKFTAFTERGAHGMRHLARLAAAGLTHVHLLPAFDFGSVDEDPAARAEPDREALQALPGDSPRQQAEVARFKDRDGFNWGYDPLHYGAPEGSYATDPDGPQRVREFRAMVAALAATGLRVVLDVVYNHTFAAGQDEHAMLDRIVPGYYHRLDADGRVLDSTCCANTASEHAMMEKLMVDTLVRWATAYKVDGFRFDLMGHHLRANLLAVRDRLRALTAAEHGVDGAALLLYGEGWDFGEVAGNGRGINATQWNMGGTGIGSFNDRLRDAARGGGAFEGYQEQGFATGLYTDPNGTPQASRDEQRRQLLLLGDVIRVSLAGNLRSYRFTCADGMELRGEQVPYHGRPAGYTLDPAENVLYVSAHDNETLWDAIQLKAAAHTGVEARVRLHALALSLVALGQGVAFFHAGDELLRSKSLDRNSYNSGDWFNALDFTCQSNNWAVGLPLAEGNRVHWAIIAPLLADRSLAVTHAHIVSALDRFCELLEIRRSSRLFRLRSAGDIQARVAFHNTGPAQIPGLIVMTVDGAGARDRYRRVAVLFNATPRAQSVAVGALRGAALALHPVQQRSGDTLVRRARFDTHAGRFRVPARTTAVFVESA